MLCTSAVILRITCSYKVLTNDGRGLAVGERQLDSDFGVESHQLRQPRSTLFLFFVSFSLPLNSPSQCCLYAVDSLSVNCAPSCDNASLSDPGPSALPADPQAVHGGVRPYPSNLPTIILNSFPANCQSLEPAVRSLPPSPSTRPMRKSLSSTKSPAMSPNPSPRVRPRPCSTPPVSPRPT